MRSTILITSKPSFCNPISLDGSLGTSGGVKMDLYLWERSLEEVRLKSISGEVRCLCRRGVWNGMSVVEVLALICGGGGIVERFLEEACGEQEIEMSM
jgi:hypothetical protein